MSELYDHISATIRGLRVGRGLSQEALAMQIKVASNTVSRWETGIYKPSAAELERLARFFKVSISVFFPNSEQTDEKNSSAAQALFSATRDLDHNDMDEILRYAEFRRARSALEKEKTKKRKTGSK